MKEVTDINSFYFDNTDGVKTLKCRALDAQGFKKHCFTTREGGISEGYLASTNLSFSREDRDTVTENYRRIAKAVGFSGCFILTDQLHHDNIQVIDESFKRGEFVSAGEDIDGLITNERGMCLTVFIADCVPIIIADPKKRAVACVHSGWRGTAKKIAARAIALMADRYQSEARDLIAAIGPCIGKCCYEVGRDVFDGFCEIDAAAKQHFESKADGKYMLDLNGANRAVLEECGLSPDNIHISHECTCCKSDIYYSHRATKGRRGNLAAMIEI